MTKSPKTCTYINWLLIAHDVGENFSSEPGGLFEEPPAMVPAVTDSVSPLDSAVAQQKNGNILILLYIYYQNYVAQLTAALYISSLHPLYSI